MKKSFRQRLALTLSTIAVAGVTAQPVVAQEPVTETSSLTESIPTESESVSESTSESSIDSGGEESNSSSQEETSQESSIPSESSSNSSEGSVPDESGSQPSQPQPQPWQSFTREDAIVRAQEGFYPMFLNNIQSMGVTQEQLDKLPDDAAFNAAVEYLLATYPVIGDYMGPINFFYRMYPEIFDEETEQVAALEDLKVAEDQFKAHFTTESEAVPFERFYPLQLAAGKYEIQDTFLVEPGEVGNQSQETYLLGIRYRYTNTTDNTANRVNKAWLLNTKVSQVFETGQQPLDLGLYELDPDQPVTAPGDVAAGEQLHYTVYYELKNVQSPLILSILQDGKIKDFTLDLNQLRKLPPQSGLYEATDNNLAYYLFDNGVVYLIYKEESDALTNWTEDYATITSYDDVKWSETAAIQLSSLNPTDLVSYTVVTIDDIYVDAVPDTSEFTFTVYKDKDDSSEKESTAVFSLTTESAWTQFTNSDNITYQRRD